MGKHRCVEAEKATLREGASHFVAGKPNGKQAEGTQAAKRGKPKREEASHSVASKPIGRQAKGTRAAKTRQARIERDSSEALWLADISRLACHALVARLP